MDTIVNTVLKNKFDSFAVYIRQFFRNIFTPLGQVSSLQKIIDLKSSLRNKEHPMKKRIPYILISLFTFLCGIAVATVLRGHPFIRGFGGDILIVIFIYGSIKVLAPELRPVFLAPGVLAFACFVEFLQYLGVPRYFDTKSLLIILTLGSTFDPADMAAYGIGALIIYLLDRYYLESLSCNYGGG